MNQSITKTGPGLSRTPLPEGFFTSGINCGVRKYRPDLGIIISECDAVTVGVFTQNQFKAAPVLYSQALLPSTSIRAIVTNSGQANAATGEEGIVNNLRMVQATAQALHCENQQIITASTGVIGQHLAIDKIESGIPELIERRVQTAEAFALAILTTDLIPKTAFIDLTLSQGPVRLTGISKGSGMIHPNMATMLGYILSDVVLTPSLAQKFLKDAVDHSFNMISVDGDTSTNDCVFMMTNGKSGISLVSKDDEIKFYNALLSLSQTLAQSIARDGEGATKLIEVRIKGAPTLEIARRAARGVTLSPLVKTAIHGEDPNWGRILARLGAEQVPSSCFTQMDLFMQGKCVFKDGSVIVFDRQEVRAALKTDTIFIDVHLKSGDCDATAWGCDLSSKYVDINTEYS